MPLNSWTYKNFCENQTITTVSTRPNRKLSTSYSQQHSSLNITRVENSFRYIHIIIRISIQIHILETLENSLHCCASWRHQLVTVPTVVFIAFHWQLFELVFVCCRNNPNSKHMSIGRKKFNMDPKKVSFCHLYVLGSIIYTFVQIEWMLHNCCLHW